MSFGLCAGEAEALQDVVGEGVPEHDGADLFDAAHGQLPQVPVAPAGMDALAYRTGLVSGLARFARHPRAPGQHPRGCRRAAAGTGRCHVWIEWADKRPRCPRHAPTRCPRHSPKPPSTRWCLGRPPGRVRCRSSMGRIKPRSDPMLQILVSTTICSPAALVTCTL